MVDLLSFAKELEAQTDLMVRSTALFFGLIKTLMCTLSQRFIDTQLDLLFIHNAVGAAWFISI